MSKRVHVILDDDIATWWQTIPERERSDALCAAVRRGIKSETVVAEARKLLQDMSVVELGSLLSQSQELVRQLQHLKQDAKVVIK